MYRNAFAGGLPAMHLPIGTGVNPRRSTMVVKHHGRSARETRPV